MKSLRRINWPIYPWMLAAGSILLVYDTAIGRVLWQQAATALAAAVLGVGVIFGIMALISRNRHQAGAGAGIVVLAWIAFALLANTPRMESIRGLLAVLIGLTAALLVLLAMWLLPAEPFEWV